MLCEHNPHRRCSVNFAPKYLVNDVLKAKCDANIRVELIDRATGQPIQEDLPDVVLIGNNDLSSFSGFKQSDDKYEQLMQKVHDDVLKAGKIFGQANAALYAKGHRLSGDAKFFQNGPSNDGWLPPARNGQRVNPNAPPPGETP